MHALTGALGVVGGACWAGGWGGEAWHRATGHSLTVQQTGNCRAKAAAPNGHLRHLRLYDGAQAKCRQQTPLLLIRQCRRNWDSLEPTEGFRSQP